MVLPVSIEERRVLEFMPLVKAHARRFYRGRVAAAMRLEELIAIGMVAVWRASQTWDTERGATFETHAYDAVLHAMMQEHLRFARHKRRGTTRSLSLPEDDQNDTELELSAHTPTPEQIVSDMQLRRLIEKLPSRERRVVERHFRDESLAEVGDEIGLSRERVRQIEWSAFRTMAKALTTKTERRR